MWHCAQASKLGESVWVMAGTYDPFALLNGVKIIGGFAGTETLATQSNPTTNVTIVDGGGLQRCVTSFNVGPGTVLRGFKIVNGYDGDDSSGGALFLRDSSLMIVGCIFEPCFVRIRSVRFAMARSITDRL